MNLGVVEQMLAERIGLNCAAMGERTLERALQQRMVVLAQSSVQSYAVILRSSEQELQALIDLLVVPETWFFRDESPFLFVRDLLRAKYRSEGLSSVALLSAPCASGEEAYSLAVATMDAGLPLEGIAVDGVDISPQQLEFARRGEYGSYSLRTRCELLRSPYFDFSGDGVKVSAAVRALVCFQHHNLLDGPAGLPHCRYDIIFCRNVLIYLTAQARRAVLTYLNALLHEKGVIVCAPAEVVLLREAGFEIVQPKAFACGKPPPARVTAPLRPKLSTRVWELPKLDLSREMSEHRAAPEPLQALPMIRALADRGDLLSAKAKISELMACAEPSSDLFCLAGEISMAKADFDEARRFLEKALYLEPQCYTALVHLALLHEQLGESERAELLRLRAAKCVTRFDEAVEPK